MRSLNLLYYSMLCVHCSGLCPAGNDGSLYFSQIFRSKTFLPTSPLEPKMRIAWICSAFTPPIIKAKGFDKANGLDLNVISKPARAYRTDFAAGRVTVRHAASPNCSAINRR